MYISKIVKIKWLQFTGNVSEMNSENILCYRMSSVAIYVLYTIV
jgi:hypothetical protein